MYRLYVVVVHIGNMLGGHYVAYMALPPSLQQSDSGKVPRDWAFISDTVIWLMSLEEVLKSRVYMRMYECI
ncbi:hypothetical protein HD554DRAFT_2110084 [Boletus coccyginus]|nr:hypothetical protein HD554DRAFT_2110084 [Boletus coccyginus]